MADYLPLVYNIVGRAMDGHPDVDDVVQETMLRAVRGLPALRQPDRFRSWLSPSAFDRCVTGGETGRAVRGPACPRTPSHGPTRRRTSPTSRSSGST
ncbi:RNA polymerase sigma factor [Streptomyces sp. NPDC003247]|uniref:RNA polymerase sigma factor n=1 Tax=Streptomyces sp. NPDC003247 TaxID=3364677 RepID=UPI0036807727